MSTHLRIAAGACVLSTGFMVAGAGGAVASADADSDGPTTGTSAAPTHGPIGTFADNVRKAVENSLQGTVQGVTGTLSTLAKPGQIQSSIPKSPKTTFGGSPTVYGSTTPATEPTPEAPESSTALEPAAPVQTAPEQLAEPLPVPPPVVAPPPGRNPAVPVVNAVASLANSIAAVPGVVGALPGSTTPVSDVLASLQNVLTSAGDAGTSLTMLPSDLAGLLGVGTGVATPSIGAATGLPRQMRTVTPDPTTPVWSAAPDLPALLGAAGGPVPVVAGAPIIPMDVATRGPVGTPAVETPPATPAPSGENDTLSKVEHAIGAFVATVSLTALAAWALPGILGLLTTCAAGIRVGYRQARAASALPHTAISRFVGSGPVGVVRSSSQVGMRSRAPRVARPVAPKVNARPALRVVGSESSTTQVLDKAV